jgi:hypothetical protein
MPDTAHLVAFLLAALVLSAIPGPGLLYFLARSLGGGRSVGMRSPYRSCWWRRQRRATALIGLGVVAALSERR